MTVWICHIPAVNPKEKKEQSQKAYHILFQMVKEQYGIDLWQENEPVKKEKSGKPYLNHHPQLCFNLSHSGDWIACAVGDYSVGIDLQYEKRMPREQMEMILEKIADKEEWMQWELAEHKGSLFYEIWTKKESYLKYTGEGIRREMKTLSYEDCRFYVLPAPKGYHSMICVQEKF